MNPSCAEIINMMLKSTKCSNETCLNYFGTNMDSNENTVIYVQNWARQREIYFSCKYYIHTRPHEKVTMFKDKLLVSITAEW